MGAQLGNLERAHPPRTLRYGRKGLLGGGFIWGSSVKGTWREGSAAGDPEGYVGLWRRASLSIGAPFWGTCRWAHLPGTLRTGRRELWDGASLSEKVLWRGPCGSSFTGDPARYVKKASGCGHLSPWGPLSIWGAPDMLT